MCFYSTKLQINVYSLGWVWVWVGEGEERRNTLILAQPPLTHPPLALNLKIVSKMQFQASHEIDKCNATIFKCYRLRIIVLITRHLVDII
jgi:hypothetical protein